jgi:hypothetical protein
MPGCPDRDTMIEGIVADLRDWLKRDPGSFWDHVTDLEYNYLKDKSDGELLEIYQESVP